MTDTTGQGRRRVLHFVTGGFSGATQVAVDLCLAGLASERIEPLLVLRRKRNTDPSRVQALRERGLSVWVVPGWSHLVTIWALARLCRQLRPAVLIAHGFPEHLLGRHAGLRAGVPGLVQVEHNSRERYTFWRLAQSRWLARRSAKLVGVSEGVRLGLVAQGLPAERTLAIPNGIALDRFAEAPKHPFAKREAGIVMSARFARQKDQLTLIRALALLRQRGLTPPVRLAGAGQSRYRRVAEKLVAELGLAGQVQFLGHHRELPQLLMQQQIFVLATHWEGMPLALVEAMAAGCACVASEVPGVEGLLVPEHSGLLVHENDAPGLADALERLLRDAGFAARLGAAARERAQAAYGLDVMTQRYEDLVVSIADAPPAAASRC